jgi:hypothetical protein
LDRPSLFAGMEDFEQDPGDDTQRVSILSTLESSRRASRRATPVPSAKAMSSRRRWMVWGSALGIVASAAVLWTFASVLMQHKPAAQPGDAVAAAQTSSPLAAGTTAASAPSNHATVAKASTANPSSSAADTDPDPLAALRATPSAQATAAPVPAPQTAVIETVATEAAPATTKPAPPAKADAPAVAVTTAKASDSAALPAPPGKVVSPTAEVPAAALAKAPAPAKPATVAEVALRGRPAQTTQTPQAGTVQAQNSATTTVVNIPPAAGSGERAGNASSKDDDVALLEAMFAHTNGRRQSASVADELRRCTSLESHAAETCRAKVCRQNPKAPACQAAP